MRYLYLIIVLTILSCNACKEPEARKPVSKKSGNYLKESIERTKKLLEKENELIQTYIKNDTVNHYIASSNGFKYTYITATDSSLSNTPVFGNNVLYTYQIEDLNGSIIYSTEEIGAKTYKVDQQNLMEGLRQTIKLMKPKETIKSIFPSQLAFGYKGDRKKISPNTPIVCTVTLHEIITTKEKPIEQKQ